MSKILIFAGTIEGRKLSEQLSNHGIRIHVCVATEYGETLLPSEEGITITSKRLDAVQMKALIKEEQITAVVDATHPYAVEVTKNIIRACEESETEYIRLLRGSIQEDLDDCIYVKSVEEAAAYLNKTEGKVLLTTGSKELAKFTVVADYQNRFYARVLSEPNVVTECAGLGFVGKNLICMQGPFNEDLNYAMLKQIQATYLVTKESGSAGGFLEKINGARRAGATCIIIRRPGQEDSTDTKTEEKGYSYEECLDMLLHRFRKKQITLLGIGMGSYEDMTVEAVNACQKADVLIGAKRMLEALQVFQKPWFSAYQPEEIAGFIREHKEYQNVVIAFSGDIGFYSGATKLIQALQEYEIHVLPGISSVVYFCSKLQMTWQDVKFASIHGREENIIAAVKNHQKVFSLLGGKDCVSRLCNKLMEYGLEEVVLNLGEQLSYPTEKITKGTPSELRDIPFSEPCAVLIENKAAANETVTHGIADEEFLRGKVPMTKEEVRSISLSKLRLTKQSVLYDIGAGTGSISIEAALQSVDGMVYAIEKNSEAVGLIKENKRKFGADNVRVIAGLAPEAMEDLPIPTHAFIGGSSGNLKEIIALLLKKNSKIRIVINAIALETIAEAVNCMKLYGFEDAEVVQAMISKSHVLGSYHMMMGQNPVYIISATGRDSL